MKQEYFQVVSLKKGSHEGFVDGNVCVVVVVVNDGKYNSSNTFSSF